MLCPWIVLIYRHCHSNILIVGTFAKEQVIFGSAFEHPARRLGESDLPAETRAMVFSSVISSQREHLPLRKILDLANLYLENACKSTDPEIVLILCHDTEVSLSHAKKTARKSGDESMNGLIAAIHVDLSDLLERQGHRDEATTFRKKSEKWGSLQARSTSLTHNKRGSGVVTIPRDIFPTNVDLPTMDFKPPEPDA
ncbi:hypothetical protein BGX34_002021, partial [Mortierella sp. NVP85]